MDKEVERKIFHLSQFIEEDLQRCLLDALTQANDRQLRDSSQLEKLAQETALDVGQVLLGAKKEFESKDEVSEAVMEKVDACDAAFSFGFILDQLRSATGVALVDEVRIDVMQLVANGRGKDPTAVAEQTQALLHGAAQRAQAELRDPYLTLADLNALAIQYCDPEKLAPRLK